MQILGAVVVATLVVGACGGDSETGSSGTTETTGSSETTETTGSSETTETTGSSETTESVAEAIPAFLATYPGIDSAQMLIEIGANEAGEALGVEVVFRTPPTFDVAAQLAVTESALSIPNLAGVSVVAADPNSLEGVMRTAESRGLALSQGAGCTPEATAPICFDSKPSTVGELAGERMAELLGTEGGEVVIASGPLGDVNNEARSDGFTEALTTNNPNATVAQVLYECSDADQTRACAENALAAHPNLRGYYGNGGFAASGGAEVFPEAGQDVVVGAIDDAPETLDYITTGEVAFTITQPQQCMGYLLILSNYLQAVEDQVATVKYVDLGATTIDKDNVGDLEAANQQTCENLIDQFTNTVFQPQS